MDALDRAEIPATGPGPAAIHPDVQAFFIDRITVQDEIFLFSYQDDRNRTAIESWSSNLHRVPVFAGTWLVHQGFPAQVRHLFLGHSAADILCFCHFRQDWFVTPNVAFAALGLLACPGQISFLKGRFINAKVHTLFDAGLTGRVTDCKIALWQTGNDAAFRLIDNLVRVSYRRKTFDIPACAFSLHRFEKTAGIRSGLRTHKPKSGFNSFHELYIDIF